MYRSNKPTRTLRTIKSNHTKSRTSVKKPPSKPPPKSNSVTISPTRPKTNDPPADLLIFDSDDETQTNVAERPVCNLKLKALSPSKPVPNKNLIKSIPNKQSTLSKPSSSISSKPSSSISFKPSSSISSKPSSSTPPVLDRKAMEAILAQSIDLIYQCDPDQNCSKEELIERLERKRDRLPEDHQERPAFDHLLKELIAEDREQKINNMNQTRSKQDQIVKKNKLKPEHFKSKTNLAPENGDYSEYGEDEQLKILVTSKKLFEKLRHYKKIPNEKANPFAKGKLRGNRKPPPDIMKSIEAKFA